MTATIYKFPLSVSRRGPKEIGPHIMTAEEVEENYGLLSLEDQAAITAEMAEIVHTRRSRRSKNGTPEERAAKAAGAVANEPSRRTRQARVLNRRKMGGDDGLFHTGAATGVNGRRLETPKPPFPKIMKRAPRSKLSPAGITRRRNRSKSQNDKITDLTKRGQPVHSADRSRKGGRTAA